MGLIKKERQRHLCTEEEQCESLQIYCETMRESAGVSLKYRKKKESL